MCFMAEDSESRSVAEYCVSEMWRDMNIKGSRLWILKMGSVGHFLQSPSRKSLNDDFNSRSSPARLS